MTDAIRPPSSLPADELAELRRAARGLEAVLIREWMEAMEKAQLESGVFGSGPGAGARTSTYHLMLSEALGEGEPLGLAERIVEELVSGEQRETKEEVINKYLSILGQSRALEAGALAPQVSPPAADE